MATNQIRTRQIADGAVTDTQVAAGAAIASSKLADGSNFVKKDGSVTITGDLNLGSQKITNLQTGSGNNDAVNVGQLNSAIASVQQMFRPKQAARAATTGNITISNPGTAVFDGVTLTSGQILWVRAQSDPAEQGLYTFNGSSSALTRTLDFDAWAEIPGAFFPVEEGTTYADTIWLCTADLGGTLGSTAVTFTQIPTATGLSNANFVDKETPSGSINGSNTTFVLANTPVSGSEHVYLNGVLQEAGSGNDYTISTATITMLTTPLSGERIKVSYRK